MKSDVRNWTLLGTILTLFFNFMFSLEGTAMIPMPAPLSRELVFSEWKQKQTTEMTNKGDDGTASEANHSKPASNVSWIVFQHSVLVFSDNFSLPLTSYHSLSWTSTVIRQLLWRQLLRRLHYVTVVFKTWNIILVSPNIHRTEICRIFTFSQKRVTYDRREGGQSPAMPVTC